MSDGDRAERRAHDVVGVDDQRQQHDAERVGDRDLGQQVDDVASGESQGVDVGSTMAAEDDAISTAYTRAWEVSTSEATAYPRTRATTPTTAARTAPVRSDVRSRGSRTGTWVPATNITSTKPQLPRKENVGSLASSTPKPLAPSTTPASSSPRTTGKVPAPRRGEDRPGQGDRADDRQVEERHDRMLDPPASGHPGMKRPPTHPAEPACPCCLPALGDSVRCRRMGGCRRV